MDTPTSPPPTPPAAQTPEAAAQPPANTVFVKKTPIQMVQLFFAGLISKVKMPSAKGSPTAGASVSPTITPQGALPLKKILIIVGAVILVVVVIVIIIRMMASRRAPIVIAPSPTPEATAPPVTPPPTRYATDSGVLEIESNVNTLDRELSEVDIDEVNIKPKSLQWEVRFDK